jgi:UDP-N-acetylglucosamine 4-epimerase
MNILVTGGAGFIGSNLADALMQDERVSLVRVLDNLATGFEDNIQHHFDHPKFQFFPGDIRNPEDCLEACKGIDAISHQAALGSVPRSIADPLTSHDVNVTGFINILDAARQSGIKRMVYASSSSVYGDLADSPKVEHRLGKVLSPYASTKLSNEIYAESWSRVYDMQLIGFRYFNVFGPRQNPDGPYAAVIPLFIKSALNNISPTINGDGSITRDFTPVENVVQVNVNGLLSPLEGNFHWVVNVACGRTTNLLQLWKMIAQACGSEQEPTFGPLRKGDVLQSLADVGNAKKLLHYEPETALDNAIEKTVNWYKENFYGNKVPSVGA